MREPPLILVVDDVPDNVEILQMRLESQGYEVITAGDGEAALAVVRDKLPELTVTNGVSPTSPYCRVETPYLTQVKLVGAYEVPRIDIQATAAFQSIPGPPLAANLVVPNATVAQSLGRSLSGGAQNITVNIIQPGSMYGDRLNQLDLRLSKLLGAARRRVSVNLDVYNVLNSNAVQVESNVYSTWRRPQSILVPRFAKISAQWDF